MFVSLFVVVYSYWCESIPTTWHDLTRGYIRCTHALLPKGQWMQSYRNIIFLLLHLFFSLSCSPLVLNNLGQFLLYVRSSTAAAAAAAASAWRLTPDWLTTVYRALLQLFGICRTISFFGNSWHGGTTCLILLLCSAWYSKGSPRRVTVIVTVIVTVPKKLLLKLYWVYALVVNVTATVTVTKKFRT